jgi:hypothetical protein
VIPPPGDPNNRSTWGFWCDSCEKFFDLVMDGKVVTHEGNYCTRYHKCGAEATYVPYRRDVVE